MNKCALDDGDIIHRYCDMNMSLTQIGDIYNVSKSTIRRHLQWNNIKISPNGYRRDAMQWSQEEDELLIQAREIGITGQRLSEEVPTRSYGAIKARLHKLRLQKKIR